MKAFDFNRFMNVARWDLTVNSKFYTRSALLMVALICMPVVLYYLYNMLTDNSFFATEISDNISFFVVCDILLGGAYAIISSGYMFHNLITRQGRINELTLPATNLERFLWHVAVIVIGVNVVYVAGVVFSDLLHALFRLAIPDAEIKSISYKLLVDFNDLREMGRVTSLFLKELDALNEKITIIATTNLFPNLDKALIRRFDAAISFDRYSREDLIDIADSILEL